MIPFILHSILASFVQIVEIHPSCSSWKWHSDFQPPTRTKRKCHSERPKKTCSGLLTQTILKPRRGRLRVLFQRTHKRASSGPCRLSLALIICQRWITKWNRGCNNKCPGTFWRRKDLRSGYPSLLSNCSGTTLMQQSDFEWSKICVLVNSWKSLILEFANSVLVRQLQLQTKINGSKSE